MDPHDPVELGTPPSTLPNSPVDSPTRVSVDSESSTRSNFNNFKPTSPPSPNLPSVNVDPSKSDIPALLAMYGDASSTSWLEDRYKIWRGENSTSERPLLQGYIPAGRYRVAWGTPLCDPRDYRLVAEGFVRDCFKHHKKTIWCCIDEQLQTILGEEGIDGNKWSTLTCLKEDVLYPDVVDLRKKEIRKNEQKALSAKVFITELKLKPPNFLPDDETKAQIENGIKAWRSSRDDNQNIASASLLPWLDAAHRRYFVAKTPSDGVVALCILTPIAHDSYQVKNSISFPNAPNGTSEALLAEVIDYMRLEERHSLSFGASASEALLPVHNLHGWKIKLLGKAYRRIVKKHDLANRGQFRSKFGTEDDASLYVAYPENSFGIEGLVSLMRHLRAD